MVGHDRTGCKVLPKRPSVKPPIFAVGEKSPVRAPCAPVTDQPQGDKISERRSQVNLSRLFPVRGVRGSLVEEFEDHGRVVQNDGVLAEDFEVYDTTWMKS